jgi:hypothetical protein
VARGGKALARTKQAADDHILPTLGTTAVGRLTREKLRAWHRALAASPYLRHPVSSCFSSWWDLLCLASLRLNGLVASRGRPRLESYELNRITLSPVRSDGTVTIISRSAR